MFNDIISLQQTSENCWQAKYQGNYGVYAIKITMKGREVAKYSCSCPSDGSPCKHIRFVKGDILEKMDANMKQENVVDIKLLLEGLSKAELVKFMAHEATYNLPLREAILLAFAERIKAPNRYAEIIRTALGAIDFDEDEYYDHQQMVTIEPLDQWLEKAREHEKNQQYTEAEAICKACIEEYADWLGSLDEEIIEGIDESYISEPFEILEAMAGAGYIDSNDLCAYCFAEVKKDKYAGLGFDDEFYMMLSQFSDGTNGDFIDLQDELLNTIDPNSREAEHIIDRKIIFYRQRNQCAKATQLLQDNLHFENFRFQYVQLLLQKKAYTEAKQLIDDFLLKVERRYYSDRWEELQLSLAQKEKDINTIQGVSFGFLKRHFDKKYFLIYKKTFSKKQWPDALEKLVEFYRGESCYFSDSLAQLFIEENQTERLLNYVQECGDISILERYHKEFEDQFPDQTVSMFRKAIKKYLQTFMGRNHYENAARLLQIVQQINGGDVVAQEMIGELKQAYKNRPALMKILGRLEKG